MPFEAKCSNIILEASPILRITYIEPAGVRDLAEKFPWPWPIKDSASESAPRLPRIAQRAFDIVH
jgi:hypothetical protein